MGVDLVSRFTSSVSTGGVAFLETPESPQGTSPPKDAHSGHAHADLCCDYPPWAPSASCCTLTRRAGRTQARPGIRLVCEIGP